MSLIESLKEQLNKTNRYARIALAAECSYRVFPVYERYWIGDFEDVVKQSIELGWSCAQGDKVDETILKDSMAELEDIVKFYSDEGISELSATIYTVYNLLKSVTSESEDDNKLAVAKCLIAARNSAKYTEAMVNIHSPKDSQEEIAAVYEKQWQDSALKLIEGWSGFATKDIFAEIREKEPQPWLKDCFERLSSR